MKVPKESTPITWSLHLEPESRMVRQIDHLVDSLQDGIQIDGIYEPDPDQPPEQTGATHLVFDLSRDVSVTFSDGWTPLYKKDSLKTSVPLGEHLTDPDFFEQLKQAIKDPEYSIIINNEVKWTDTPSPIVSIKAEDFFKQKGLAFSSALDKHSVMVARTIIAETGVADTSLHTIRAWIRKNVKCARLEIWMKPTRLRAFS